MYQAKVGTMSSLPTEETRSFGELSEAAPRKRESNYNVEEQEKEKE